MSTVNTTNTTTTPFSIGVIEQIFFDLLTPVLIMLLIGLIYLVITRFLTALMNRGRISASTKATLSRLIGIISVFTIIVVFLQVIVSIELLVITIAILAFVSILIFFYELREFIAYINLQLLRHLHGRNYEIKLPYHEKPIYGRIVNIEPLSSTIEDIYGRRIYVANSLLVNSVMKEYIPSIQLRIRLSHAEGDPFTVVKDITDSIKAIDLGIFRLDEKKIIIEKIGGGEVVTRINAYPTSLPIRLTDLVKLADSLNKSLTKYNPIIEFIDTEYH